MRRTIGLLVTAWLVLKLWWHNHRVMRKVAAESARFYTNLGVKCDANSPLVHEPLEPSPIKAMNQEINDEGNVPTKRWINPSQQFESGGQGGDSGGGAT